MLYKLVIVDDEAAIRRGMCNYIPWEEMGYQVVADFEDGKETIDYISKHPVDVIITDIEMAEVSGLELTKYLTEQGHAVKVIILSGYKLFEYAQKAIEYKVESYLLKPLHMDQVKAVFGKIKIDLDLAYEKKQLDIKEQENLNALLSALQEQFFISLLVGGIKKDEAILDKCKFLKLDLKMDRPYAVLDLSMDYENESDITFFQHQENKQKLLHNMFGKSSGAIDYYIADLSFQIIKIIAVSVEKVEIEQFNQELLYEIKEKCLATNQLFHLKVTIEVDQLFNNMSELLNYNVALKPKPYELSNKHKIDTSDSKKIMDAYKKLVKIINEGEFDGLNKYIEEVFFELRKEPQENLRQLVIDLFSMFSSKLLKMDNELWLVMVEKIDYQEIISCHSRVELKELCTDYVNYCIGLVNNSRNDTTKKVIIEAMNYIKHNFKEDISLDSISERYYLNSAYFSRVFKQYSGATFTDYLIEVRMTQAIKYIETGQFKMYEISSMVGYNSEKYFFRVFKQYTGYSPAEYYRSKVLKNG